MKIFSKILLILSLFFFFYSSSISGKDLPLAQPHQVGLSAERLEQLKQVVQSYVDQKKLAGAVTLVARHGKVAHMETYGMSDINAGSPMQPNSIFRIASMTKPIISVGTMILYEEGKFMLNDPLSKYLPEFVEQKVLVPNADGKTYELVDTKRKITIHDLLTHASGINYRFLSGKHLLALFEEAGISDGIIETPGTIGEMTKKLAKLPRQIQPGSDWRYGLSFDVLGRLIEVVSGMPLDQFLQKRIFTPLGMEDTQFYISEEQRSRLVTAYQFDKNGNLEEMKGKSKIGNLLYSATFPYSGEKTYFSGGAGLTSTIPDYARFSQMLLNNGELNAVRLLSRKTIETMTINQIGKSKTSAGQKYGLGFHILTDLRRHGELGSAGEYSWQGGFNTFFWVDPKEDMVSIILMQYFPFRGLDVNGKFHTLALQAIVD